MVSRPGARQQDLSGPEEGRRRAPAPYRVRERALPEHRGVLGRTDGDVHDPGGHLYTQVWVLRGEDRSSGAGLGLE